MFSVFSVVSLFWLLRTTKAVLFWIYLWQLKEYHTGRFLDHFQTEKGKNLFINPLFLFKGFLVIAFIAGLDLLPLFILFFIYLLEAVKVFFDLLGTNLKKPVFTKKTILLVLVCLLAEFLIIFSIFTYTNSGDVEKSPLIVFLFLVFDILLPIIVSIIVLIFQPLAVLGRNQIIKKAKVKRAIFKDLLVIGITGSYGKTSVKEFLATILSEKFKVLKTEKHQNSEVGISQCILNNLKPEHEIFICEIGAYKRGEIKTSCNIIKPKIGILTGINVQHMATFGSQENIIKAKYELIENLPIDGVGIFNGNDEETSDLYLKTELKKRIFSYQSLISGKQPDIWIRDVETQKDFIDFRIQAKDELVNFKVNLLGKQNIDNILLAVLAARELEMSFEEISKALEKIKSEQSGMVIKKGFNNIHIVDATYSANPDGVISHLEYLRLWEGQKIIIMPCLIELGKSSKEVHKRIGQKIGEVCDLAIITTKDRFEELKSGAIEGTRLPARQGMKKENILFIENPRKIFEKVKTFTKPDDVILLESRVPKKIINLLAN